ncbi:MAG: ATP-binding protein [Lautropia sp.]
MGDRAKPEGAYEPARPAAPGARAEELEVIDELVALHARVLLRMPIVVLLVVAAVALQALDRIPTPLFAGWAIALLAIEGARAWYGRRLLERAARRAEEQVVVHRRLVVLAGLAGAAVGASALLFFPRLPAELQALLALIYFAMTAGGVAVSASSQAILAAYSISMLTPAAIAWGLAHPSQAAATTGLATLYCGFLILLAGDGERLLSRSIRIRRERDRVVQDLEQRNADVQVAVAAAEASALARARVLAAASHDLRQPLHALSIYSAVLAASPDPPTLAEVSRSIDQLVRALGNLLNGLLDLSRLSSGHYVPDLRVFALDEVAADVIAQMRVPIEEKGLALDCRLEPVTVRSDPGALGRVLRNLLDNALKYTDAGRITVEVFARQGSAVVAVQDTGKGIPEAEQIRIFEEFYQLDNEARDRAKGVGLGLAIVQRLCELLGGRIGVQSQPGAGARFELVLPLPAEPLQIAGAAVSAPAVEARLDARRVYVVDDEPEIRRSMQTLLTLWGLEVRTAGSVAEVDALFAASGPPDLLLVDLRLGDGEHGAALAQRLLASPGRYGVLIVTGETSSDALAAAHRQKFPLLQKPITPEALRRAAAEALAWR